MANRIQFKRGVKASLPTLSVGEPAITTDSKEFYLGSAAGNMSVAMDTDVPSVPVVLSPGVQTIRADRTSRLAHVGFKGRTLVNLLGREGNCENLTGWLSSAGSLTVDNANARYGLYSHKFTLSATSGTSFRDFTGKFQAGKYYLLAVDVKNGNASSGVRLIANFVSSTTLNHSLTTSTSFVTQCLRIPPSAFASATRVDIAFGVSGATGQYAFADGFRLYEVSASEYAAMDNMTEAEIAARYPYTEGISNVDNVYIHRLGSDGAVDQALYAYDMQAASNVDGSIRDEVYTDKDGRLRINRRFKTMALTGDLPWDAAVPYSLLKRVSFKHKLSPVMRSGLGVKYDGKILQDYMTTGGTNNTSDVQTIDGQDIYFWINNADSGWGADYVPSLPEIQAYFNGWVMSNNFAFGLPYNGTGTRAWEKRYSGQGAMRDTGFGSYTVNGSGVLTVPTTMNEMGFTPYQLQYQLATAVDEPIRQEGALTLLAGNNQIEMGSGVIVRERANPLKDAANYNINNWSESYESDRMVYRVGKFIQIYRDGTADNVWTYANLTTTGGYGGYLAQALNANGDDAAVYTVTYMALDTYFTGIPPLIINADIAANLRKALDGAVTDIAALTGRVDVLQSSKADVRQPKSGAFAYPAAATSLPSISTWYKINLGNDFIDTLNEFNTSLYRFTSAKGGLYLINASAEITNLVSGERILFGIFRNGSIDTYLADLQYSGVASHTNNASCQILLYPGDYIEYYAYTQTITNTKTINGTPSVTYFKIIQIA